MFELSYDELANILYNMSLGMDYADHIDFADIEISNISAALKSSESDELIGCLEMIALGNSELYDWHKRIRRDA